MAIDILFKIELSFCSSKYHCHHGNTTHAKVPGARRQGPKPEAAARP